MKIGKIIGYPAMALLVTYCVGSTYNDMRKAEQNFIANASKEIHTKDINRYNKILNNVLSGSTQNNSEMWNRELTVMRDSLRVDSLCKKAYFDGAQMVRDSIAKANLNNTVKTVMKSVK